MNRFKGHINTKILHLKHLKVYISLCIKNTLQFRMSTKRDPTSLSQGKYWVFPSDPGSQETTIKKIDASLFLQEKTQSCSWKSDLLFFFFFPPDLGDHSCTEENRNTESYCDSFQPRRKYMANPVIQPIMILCSGARQLHAILLFWWKLINLPK